MKWNHEKMILGFIFLIAGALFLFFKPNMTDIEVFGYTLGAFLFSLSSIFSGTRAKWEQIIKGILYALGLSSILILRYFENNLFIESIVQVININAFLMFSLGIAFIAGIIADKEREIEMKRLENEKRRAVIEERKHITEEIEKKLHKK